MINYPKPIKTVWPLAIFCLVILTSCTEGPPKEEGDFKESDLVELIKLDPGFKLDIRYATKNNLVGRPVYSEARAFLQRPAAEALVKINNELKRHGFGLMIFDGYRPWSVTKTFWDITPEVDKKFVAKKKTTIKQKEVLEEAPKTQLKDSPKTLLGKFWRWMNTY